MMDGVHHVEIDAESRLDLVRRLNIFATPTVLVLGPDGAIARKASGQPRKADVIAAIGQLAGGQPPPELAAKRPWPRQETELPVQPITY